MAPSSSALRKPAAARSSASSQLAALSSPWSRTSGWVSRVSPGDMLRTYRTGEPAGRPAPDHIIVVQCELASPRPGVLRTQVGAPGHERLEQRRVVECRADHVGGPRAVEVQQMAARRGVELDRPVDLSEAGGARQRPRRTVQVANAE